MESGTVAAPQAPPEPEPSHDGVVEATRSTEELFQWSGYVHVGAGAEECEHRLDGKCEAPPRIVDGRMSGHFHAWVTLPNPYQFRDIDEKARASQARKTRALKDEDSDSRLALEAALEEIVGSDDRYELLVGSIARVRVEKQLPEVIEELQADDRFEHHAQDVEEFQRLEALTEDERDQEAFEHLQADMTAYAETSRAIIEGREERELAQLREMPREEVIEMERKLRMEQIAQEVYWHNYYVWTIYTGTREPVMDELPSKRKFHEPGDLKNAAPEVIAALRDKVRDLEGRLVGRGDAAGN